VNETGDDRPPDKLNFWTALTPILFDTILTMSLTANDTIAFEAILLVVINN
jgi:hypothetical protein